MDSNESEIVVLNIDLEKKTDILSVVQSDFESVIPKTKRQCHRRILYPTMLCIYLFVFFEYCKFFSESSQDYTDVQFQNAIISATLKLTNWGLIGNLLYYLFNVLLLFSSPAEKYLSIIYSGLIFSLSLAVSIFYGTLFIATGGAINDEKYGVPPYINFLIHGLPVILTLIECLIIKHEKLTFKQMVVLAYVAGLSYVFINLVSYWTIGIWAYEDQCQWMYDNIWYGAPINLICILFGTSFSLLGRFLNGYCHN